MQALQSLVDLFVAGSAGHGLAQYHQAPFGPLDPGGLGVVQRAAGLQAGDGLQGEEQQKAEGDGHCQLAAELLAVFEPRIMGPQLDGDLQQGQTEQGEGGAVDQGASEAQLPGRIKQLQRE